MYKNILIAETFDDGKFWCFWWFPVRKSKFNPYIFKCVTEFTDEWWKSVTIHPVKYLMNHYSSTFLLSKFCTVWYMRKAKVWPSLCLYVCLIVSALPPLKLLAWKLLPGGHKFNITWFHWLLFFDTSRHSQTVTDHHGNFNILDSNTITKLWTETGISIIYCND